MIAEICIFSQTFIFEKNLGMNVYIRNNPDYNINNENVLKNPNCNPANLIGDFEQI